MAWTPFTCQLHCSKTPRQTAKEELQGVDLTGFGSNSFLKLFSGLNKGKPNAEDPADSEEFARALKEKMERGKQRWAPGRRSSLQWRGRTESRVSLPGSLYLGFRA
jgi:hypothetical protein